MVKNATMIARDYRDVLDAVTTAAKSDPCRPKALPRGTLRGLRAVTTTYLGYLILASQPCIISRTRAGSGGTAIVPE